MRASGAGPGGVTLALFGVAVTLGAGNFLAVRLSNLELPPFWGAGIRFALAALAFVVLSTALRVALPGTRSAVRMTAFGVFSFGCFYALMYWALLHVTAGVATVLLALVPLATVLLAAAQGLERLRPRSVAGGALAVVGIAWIALEPGRQSLPPAALVALLAAVLCVGQGFILGKRLQEHHPALVNAVGMTVGAVLLLSLSALVGEPWALPRRPEAAWALAYLVTLGSVGLFLVTLTVIRRWTASSTSYMFVLFPVATMALEALLLGERVTSSAVVGAALVIAGVWTGALAPDRPRAPREPAAPAA
jgi:drug/metabolite transporter (DMT)-like permease